MERGDSQNAQDVHGSEIIPITGSKHAKNWGILKGIVNVGLTKSITSPTIVSSPVEVIGMCKSLQRTIICDSPLYF